MLDPASLSIIKDFIDIGKQLYGYLSPDYKEAAEDLIKITNNILAGQSEVLKWVRKFEGIDLDNRKEFDYFHDEFYSFRDGTGYDSIGINCPQIRSIYHNSLAKYLKRLLASDKEKLRKAQDIISNLGTWDDEMHGIAKNILTRLELTLENIKSDYTIAKNLRNDFLAQTSDDVKMLRAQSDELRNLRGEFIKKANIVLS